MSFSSADQAFRRRLVFLLLAAGGVLRRALSSSENTYRLLFVPGLESVRWRFGKWHAWLAYERARRNVPAYRDFLEQAGGGPVVARGLDPDLTAIPVTDKESYVKRYSIEDRCCDGRMPTSGVIDESSGTSGTPNNWVRGPAELAEVRQALQMAMHYQLGTDPLFVVNAFALGPWATGMNVSMSVVDIAILKSTGPDIGKIESTLRLFGPRYRYLITGYPPFLKALVDTADVDWSALDATAIYGGEGMSEAMRDYLGRFFRQIYGSYGASDLEINLAAENDFTIALRRRLAGSESLRERLVRIPDAGLPMIFQYNPIDYYIETVADELVVTLCRTRNASPKIRYNIHDLGHVVRFPELARVLREEGVALDELAPKRSDLPLLFLYGRADATVAYFGSKVTPADVEQVVFSLPELAERVSSFALLVSEDTDATKRLAIALELREGTAPLEDPDGHLRERVLEKLREVNQDFREASRFIPADSVPTLEQFASGDGPFAGHDVRLKRHYVQRR